MLALFLAVGPIVHAIIVIVVLGAIVWLVDQTPIDATFKKWVRILCIVVMIVVVLLLLFGVMSPFLNF